MLTETLNNHPDSENAWVYDILLGRPVLKDNKETYTATEEQPFEIPDKVTLENFRNYVNAGNNCEGMYFEVTNNINLGGSDEDQWTPIGNMSDFDKRFKGTFDGGGHAISGLYINDKSEQYLGLFGFILGATVKNLTVSGSVSGLEYVGGVAAHSDMGSMIENCTNNCNVSSDMGYAGGIVGSCSGDSRISGCSNTGAISASLMGSSGGIAGYLDGVSSSVTDCFN